MMKDSHFFFILPGGPRLYCFTALLALLGVYVFLSVLLLVSFSWGWGLLVSKKIFQLAILGLSNCS